MTVHHRLMMSLVAVVAAVAWTAPASATELPEISASDRGPVVIEPDPGLEKPARPMPVKVATHRMLPRRGFVRCSHLGCPGYVILGVGF
jgi:hypothetical protein